MKIYRDEGIVLRTHKLGEADRIITLLTRYHGQIRAVAKGVRRTNSRFGARVEPFGVVDAQIHIGRNLDVLTQVETIAPYGRNICTDYGLYTVATVMVETAERLTADDNQSTQDYTLLLGALHALSNRSHAPELVLGSYLLRALAVAGWAPSCFDCAICSKPGPHRAFNISSGGVVCDGCVPSASATPAPQTLDLLGALLSGDWISAEDTPEYVRREAGSLIAAYTQWHVERRLKSLPFVERSA